MNLREITINLLQHLSGEHPGKGEGSIEQIILLVLGVFVIIGLIFLILKILLGGKSASGSGKSDFSSLAGKGKGAVPFDRVTGVMGRLEKLEMTLNEFKTEVMRAQEFSKIEFEYIRKALGELKGLADRQTPGGSGGSGGGGSGGGQVPSPGSGKSSGAKTEDWELQKARSYLRSRKTTEHISVPVLPEENRNAQPAGTSDREAGEVGKGPDFWAVEAQREGAESPPPQKLEARLSETRRGIFSRLRKVFAKRPDLNDQMMEELEALLVGSDMGVKTVCTLLEKVRDSVAAGERVDQAAFVGMLRDKVLSILTLNAPASSEIVPAGGPGKPFVVMVVGVNGVGKTTTVAKLAHRWKEDGHRVMLAAADTFRAAAVEQLCQWGERTGVPVVRGPEGAKPSTVVYEAMERAQQENCDVLIIDTAGRLHTKVNLLQELEGVRNIVRRHQLDAPHETILVVDGSTGQNAVSQAREFHAAVPLTGLVVTKLDGTPKGGVVVAIKSELGIPVRYIGVGERREDLRPFVAQEFIDALFTSEGSDDGPGDDGSPEEPGRTKRQVTTWAI